MPKLESDSHLTSVRISQAHLDKLEYIARHDSEKGRRVTVSDLIRSAIAYLLRRRTHTIYPPKVEEGELNNEN
jgi:Arc/MetJ-type ribon-helix-helix transcriptional regulator